MVELKLIKYKKKYDFIIAPFNSSSEGSGSHWMLSILNLNDKSIIILDSILKPDYFYYEKFQHLIGIFNLFYKINNLELNLNDIRCFICQNSPQQTNKDGKYNYFECGPYVCWYMQRFLLLDFAKRFNQKFKDEISSCILKLTELSNIDVSRKNIKEDHSLKPYLESDFIKNIKVHIEKIKFKNIFYH